MHAQSTDTVPQGKRPGTPHLFRRAEALREFKAEIASAVAIFLFGMCVTFWTTSPSDKVFSVAVVLTIATSLLGFITPLMVKLYPRLMTEHMSPEEQEAKSNQAANFLLDAGQHLRLATETAYKELDQSGERIMSRVGEAIDERFGHWQSQLLSKPAVFQIDGFKEVHDAWDAWGVVVTSQAGSREDPAGRLQHEAWRVYTRKHLEGVAKRLSNKFVLTDTNAFTALSSGLTELVRSQHHVRAGRKRSATRRRILRYHLTAMLPEEFYNGPQIERLSSSSRPLIFPHKWESYDKFYSDSVGEDVIVRRCIITRDTDAGIDALGSLPTFAALKAQAGLHVWPHYVNAKAGLVLDEHECWAVRDRLLRYGWPDKDGTLVRPSPSAQTRTAEQAKAQRELINNILNVDRYSYMPIVSAEDCVNTGCECKRAGKWTPLLKEFTGRQFHTCEDDALFCKLGSTAWIELQNYTELRWCFKPGWTPEIVLFGDVSKDGNNPEWLFGLVGHYLPFTPQIELMFFNASKTAALYHDFTAVLCKDNGCHPHRLASLMGVDDTQP